MPTDLQVAEAIGNTSVIKRKSRVKAFVDLPGVPKGTRGYVALINGFDKWIRYRVLFENGVDLGTIERSSLVPAKQYDTFVAKRRTALESGELDRLDQGAAASDDADAGDAAAGGGGADVVVNGVTVPGHLIARSASARERLGVPA